MLLILLEPQTNAINPPNQWVLIVLGALTIVYIVFIRPKRNAKKPDPLQRTAGQSNLAHQRAIEREMSNLLVEYEEMIRRMTAQVDTRAARLEALIHEADEKLAALRAASEAAAGSSGDLSRQRDAASEMPSGATDGNRDDATTSASASAAPSAAPVDRRHGEVYDMADKGRTPRQIAQDLNRPHGEIELILALRGTGAP